ncbi:DMT family transporter [Jatrophihabitans sp. DSM 45814]
MHIGWLVIGLTLGSAFAFGASTALKHSSASDVPKVHAMRAGVVMRFVGATVSHPRWLAGIVLDVVGVSLQVLALHFGALSIVQPLLVSGLLFSLLLRSRDGRGIRAITAAELLWAGVLCATLVGFYFLSGSGHGGMPSHEVPDRMSAFLSAVAGLIIAVGCILIARRHGAARYGPALIGIAVGVTYAATAALIKGVTDIAVRSPLDCLTSWQLYALIVVGGCGLFLSQVAFQAGPLTASLPATATVDPLLSIVVGVVVYNEHVRHGPFSGAGLLGLLVILGVAVIQLCRLEAPKLVSSNDPVPVPIEPLLLAEPAALAVPVVVGADRLNSERLNSERWNSERVPVVSTAARSSAATSRAAADRRRA